MNSDERRAARRIRREEKRARKKRERCENSTLDTVADLNALYKAQREAARVLHGRQARNATKSTGFSIS